MAITFTSKAQEDTYNKAKGFLHELFGEMVVGPEDQPVFGLQTGSAWTTLAVYPWGDNDAVITSRSYVVTEVDLTEDLMQYLLKQNDTMRFGAFGVDKEDDIFFEYSIVGSTMQKEEIKAAALAVAMTADKYDDEIVAKWGGLKAVDRH